MSFKMSPRQRPDKAFLHLALDYQALSNCCNCPASKLDENFCQMELDFQNLFFQIRILTSKLQALKGSEHALYHHFEEIQVGVCKSQRGVTSAKRH
jgi:hypothetical protein